MILNELNKLDTFIKENRSFAIYRRPGEDKLYIIVAESSENIRLLTGIEELNELNGFVIAPFHADRTSPIVLIQAVPKELVIQPEDKPLISDKTPDREPVPPVSETYSQLFDTFITPIREKSFKKLVLSHCQTIERETGFSPTRAFLMACEKYTRSYVYLCHTPQTGTWLGSTPEMLLSGKGNVWNTVAIAGTQPLINGELPASWDDKNLIEQMLVAYYIRTQLSSFGLHAREKGPYTVKAGELAHLRSDYLFPLPDTAQLGSLLQLLHPTPAVSGLPKEEAYRFILEHEAYNRRYYSGFIGWMDPDTQSDLYVNLRCMNIQDDSLTLYAGGGLLPSSSVEDEWKETQDKFQTMLFLTKTKHYVF